MEMYDLGSKPAQAEPVGMEEKKRYPCLYDVNVDTYPPLGEMKLGETGEAKIKFQIAKNGGIEIVAMGPLKDAVEDEKA